MSWTKGNDASGGPIWVGTDSIFDPYWKTRRDRAQFAALGVAFGVGLASLVLVEVPVMVLLEKLLSPQSPVVIYGGRLLSVVVFLIAAAAGGLYWVGKSPSKFINRDWSLTVKAGALVYEAGAFQPYLNPLQVSRDGASWQVPLAAIGTVETSQSTAWQGARRYEGGPISNPADRVEEVPSAEYQVYLTMTDQTRRIVHIANADREGCASLAASIRAYVEAQRMAATPAPVAASPSALAEGFDL